MSLVHLNFESQLLNNNTDVNVILPDKPRGASPAEFYSSGKKYKVLWLLHGTFGDYSDWLRKTNIEVYACERDLVVVMPSALNSVYENWPDFCLGFNMFDFLTQELMPLIYGWFPVSRKREDNFIAGLSMGGRGTMKFALACPELFAGAAILSAAPTDMDSNRARFEKIAASDPAELSSFEMRTRNDIARCGGVEGYLDSMENRWRHLAEMAPAGRLPKLFFGMGTEDGMYADFLKFQAFAENLPGIETKFVTGPGRHEWRVWDRDIQLAMDWFGIGTDKAAGKPF